MENYGRIWDTDIILPFKKRIMKILRLTVNNRLDLVFAKQTISNLKYIGDQYENRESNKWKKILSLCWSKHNNIQHADMFDSFVVYLADRGGIRDTDSGSPVLAI